MRRVQGSVMRTSHRVAKKAATRPYVGSVSSELVRVFFFSSRRRHTRLQGDWSSDVCSSDLRGDDARPLARPLPLEAGERAPELIAAHGIAITSQRIADDLHGPLALALLPVRSEERRVGKECRSRWSPYH